MKSHFLFSLRIYVLVALVIFGFAGLQARLFYLQVQESGYYNEFAQKNRNRENTKQAKRGNIFDNNGKLLASTRSFIQLGVDPQAVIDKDLQKLPELAKITGVPEATLRAIVTRRHRDNPEDPSKPIEIRWTKLVDKLDEETYLKVQKLNLKSIYGNRVYERVYPQDQLAAHVIGFLNKEGTPTFGIERQLDKYLRGIDGWYATENDRRNREVLHFRTTDVEPMDGWNVELTIDSVIQHIAEEEIKKVVEEFKPQSVSIIVSDPKTGFVSALANYPTFNLNEYSKAPQETQRNRAVTDLFEPGSTFKIVPIAGAIQERLVRPIDEFNCNITSIAYKGRNIPLPRDSHSNGVLTVAQITQKSSNIGAAHLGVKLEPEKLYFYAKQFGYGERTDSGLSGEIPGILNPPNRWDGLTITRLPMGHAIAATPLQVHFAMSVIANEGKLMRPQFIRRIYQDEHSDGIYFEPIVRRQVLEPWAAKEMATMLAAVTKPGGTALRAALVGFETAGKTGTTQKIINGRYSRSEHVGSFTGFFPAQNPKYLITIIVDGGKPKNGGLGYGGIIAAPSFRHIAEQIIKYKGIQPDVQDKRSEAIYGF